MAFVKVDETEPLEKAIKRFKRMVEKEGVIRDYKMRRYFEKPSAIQHRKNKAMARKQMLKNKKMHASKAYWALLKTEALGFPGAFLISTRRGKFDGKDWYQDIAGPESNQAF